MPTNTIITNKQPVHGSNCNSSVSNFTNIYTIIWHIYNSM